MKIELWPIAKVKPYANNPRANDQAVAAVAASIREFGFRQPIVVDVKGVIVAGHTRYQAALKLKLARVPVHVAKDLTAKQLRAYRLADNKTGELAEWDNEKLRSELAELAAETFDMSVLGFDEAELAALADGPADGKPKLTTLDPRRPPKLSWVLVGIPTPRFGEIAAQVEAIAAVNGVMIETTITD